MASVVMLWLGPRKAGFLFGHERGQNKPDTARINTAVRAAQPKE
jgi:hypothetical protein